MKTPSTRPPKKIIVEHAEITGMHASGAGIAAVPVNGRDGADGFDALEVLQVLVPGALPGASGRLEYTPPAPGGRRGLAVSWQERSASPDADSKRCPHAWENPACGGCPMGRLGYARELELKTQILVEAPLREAGLWREGLIAEPAGISADFMQGFRNKAVLYPGVIEGQGRLGYFAARSQELVPAEDCPQVPKWMHEAAKCLAPFVADGTLAPAPEAGGGVLRNLLLREAPGTGERMLVLVVRNADAALETAKPRILRALSALQLDSLLINSHPGSGSAVFNFAPKATQLWAGKPAIAAELMGLRFAVGPQTFLQVNTPQTPVLYQKALDAADIQPGDKVLDLYCGIGTLTLLAARRARGADGSEGAESGRVWGVERVEASIDRARENSLRNGLSQACFAAEPAEDFLARVLREGIPGGGMPEKIIADPAFQGLSGGAAERLAELLRRSSAKRLAYVSCNPKSFARDGVILARSGMRLERVEPVDMFPGAMHLEVVGTFVRGE